MNEPNSRRVRLAVLSLACLFCAALGLGAPPEAGPGQLQPLKSSAVKVNGELGRAIDATIHNNLLVLNVERDFLAPFQGDSEKRKGSYIGLGKLVEAAVRFADYSGEEEVKAFKQKLVAGVIAAQEPDGYIGTKRTAERMGTLWDVHEMSYLILGLSADYRYFGEQSSLAAATKLADYLIAHWTNWRKEPIAASDAKFPPGAIGLESAMFALYEESGDTRYLDFCREARKITEWQPRHVGNGPELDGHSYTDLCNCLAQLRLSRLNPDPRLLSASHQVMAFLTQANGLAISGECSDREHWHSTQEGTINLGETCATAYLIRWLDELLQIEGDPLYGDLMERVVYNALLAAHSPDGRRIRYFTPFDGARTYFSGDTFCCPNNFRRIVAELPGMIYYRTNGGIAVNLFTASTAALELRPGLTVKVRQETDFPHDGKVTLHVEPSQAAKFPIRIRVPSWCTSAAVKINDRPLSSEIRAGEFLVLDRNWSLGDRIELSLPMPLRIIAGRGTQIGRVAVMRGPRVYGLSRKANPELEHADLRLLVADLDSLGFSPEPNSAPACRIKVWLPSTESPFESKGKKYTVILSEFPDPDVEAIYFKVPNLPPVTPERDELLQRDPKTP